MVVVGYSILITVVPASRLEAFELTYMESAWLNGYVLGMGILFSGALYMTQKCLLEPLSVRLRRRYPHREWI